MLLTLARSPNDGFGSTASICGAHVYVRFTLDSDRIADTPDRPLRATSRHMQCSKRTGYSITSSARASSVGGTLSPSVFAVP
jgi:hypothetical protein